MKKVLSLLVIALTLFTFIGCSEKESEINIPVSDILKSIKDEIAKDMIADGAPEDSFKDGNIPRFMETSLISEDAKGLLVDMFNKEDIEEGLIFQHMMNVKSDLIIVLKAKDETKVKSLRESLDKVKEQQDKIWSTYLPDQYEKVKNNIIEAKGNYIIYITSDNPEKIKNVFESILNQ